MLPAKIDAVSIRGFRSLADVTLADLPDATVLIGANGSGKSNFLRFFEHAELDGRQYVGWESSSSAKEVLMTNCSGAVERHPA